MKKNNWLNLALLLIWMASCTQNENKKSEGNSPDSTLLIEEEKGKPEKQEDKGALTNPSLFKQIPNPLVDSSPKNYSKLDNTRRPVESPEEEPFLNFFNPEYKKPEIFLFDPERDTTLLCKEGTKIEIKASSFIFEKSGLSPKRNIQLSVEEYYKVTDMLRAKLTTTSNGKLLETGGMLRLEAKSEGEALILRNGSNLQIRMAEDTQMEKGMQSFSGSLNNGNQMNWNQNQEENNYFDNSFISTHSIYFIPSSGPSLDNDFYKQLARYLSDSLTYYAKSHSIIPDHAKVSFEVTKEGEIKTIKLIGNRVISDAGKTIAGAFKSKLKPGNIMGRPVNASVTVKYKVWKTWKGKLKFKFEPENTGLFVTKNKDIKVWSKLLEVPNREDSIKYRESLMKNTSDSLWIKRSKIRQMASRNLWLTAPSLGWINCDRFYNSNPLVTVNVAYPKEKEVIMFLVFRKIKSIMAGNEGFGNYHFPNIPKGKEVVLISMLRENNDLKIAVKKFDASGNYITNLEYKPENDPQIRAELASLDKKRK